MYTYMYMMYMSITCSMIIIFYSNGGVRPVEIRVHIHVNMLYIHMYSKYTCTRTCI